MICGKEAPTLKPLKIVIIGAGSTSFGAKTINDIMQEERLREFELVLSLVDIDQLALQRMHRFALFLKEHYRCHHLRVEATTDRKEVLRGAHYIIISVAQNRWDMWEKDFYIPLTFGFKQVYGENGGPGAAFHTLRSLHLTMPICEDIEKFCPEALILNYTNPESRVCLAIKKLTHLRAVGLCHGPVTTWKKVAEIMEMSPQDIDVTVGGINHFHWVMAVHDKKGQDLTPDFQKRLTNGKIKNFSSFVQVMYDLYGHLVYPSSSHPEEYVPFAYSITGPLLFHWGIGRVARRPNTTVDDLEFTIEDQSQSPSYELWCAHWTQVVQEVIERRRPLPRDFEEFSEELAVPIICDMEYDVCKRELAANVPNEGLAIPNLPEDAIVEVPVVVDREGIHPVRIGPLPEAIAAMCRLQISIQNLLVAAYRERSKTLLLQALLLEPGVDDLRCAEEMMHLMLRLQAGHLPEMH